MINPFKEINWTPDKIAIGKFGTVLMIGFSIIGTAIFLLNLYNGMTTGDALCLPTYLIGGAFTLFILTKCLPKATLPFYYLWFGISASIGIVIANTILMLFYYLLFSTFAVIFRTISGRDPLQLKHPQDNIKSFWVPCRKTRSIKSYLRQY